MTVPSNSLPSLDDFRPAAELSIVLDTIVDAICGIDADGRVTFCNKAFAEITGYSKEEAIGKDLHSLLQPERSDGIARSSSEFAPTNLPPVSEVHVPRQKIVLLWTSCTAMSRIQLNNFAPLLRRKHLAALFESFGYIELNNLCHNTPCPFPGRGTVILRPIDGRHSQLLTTRFVRYPVSGPFRQLSIHTNNCGNPGSSVTAISTGK